MPPKPNSEVHVHGIDGIHVGIDEATGKLALYWGESKLAVLTLTLYRPIEASRSGAQSMSTLAS
jgi:hypothetical protein